jgi:hypothetical protein
MMEVFNRAWGWGPSGLVLKEWSISFDPTRDVHSPSKVWAILPNFPLAFWHEEILVAIGNKLENSLALNLDGNPRLKNVGPGYK